MTANNSERTEKLLEYKHLIQRANEAVAEGDLSKARSCRDRALECIRQIAALTSDPADRDKLRLLEENLRSQTVRRKVHAHKAHGQHRPTERRTRGRFCTPERPDRTFADVAGLEEVKEEIRHQVVYPWKNPALAREYGIKVGGGILLFGPPGTGKTLIAQAVAGELDAWMFPITPAQLMGGIVGETEKSIRALFKEARDKARRGARDRKPRCSVIFLDEIDALLPRRRERESDVMNRAVPQILQELSGYHRHADHPLLFIGATNLPWLLDPAVLRPGRFDAKIRVPLPDEPARRKLFEIHLKNARGKSLGDDIRWDELAQKTEQYTGAEIELICNRAARQPFINSMNSEIRFRITMNDVLKAIRDVPASVTRAECEKHEKWEKDPTWSPDKRPTVVG